MTYRVAMNDLTTATDLHADSLPVRVSLAGTANTRDLGGYLTEQGDRVRGGLLYRSDSPHRLAADDAAFARLGIRTVVDLRSDDEVDRLGRPPLGAAVRAYVHAPLRMAAPTAGGDGVMAALAQLRRDGTLTLGKLYCHYVTQSGEELRTVVRLLSDEHAYPALFYCVVGKDRTGIVAAIILGLLGVPDETIAADYAATADSLERFFELAREDDSLGEGARGQQVDPSFLAAEAQTMLSFLGWIRAEFGSVENMVTGFGIDQATIASLRRNLLTPVP
jgi:protein tyrosine/serine phosphatase